MLESIGWRLNVYYMRRENTLIIYLTEEGWYFITQTSVQSGD